MAKTCTTIDCINEGTIFDDEINYCFHCGSELQDCDESGLEPEAESEDVE